MTDYGRSVKLVAASIVFALQMLGVVPAQAVETDESECMFDAEAPTVLSARASFRAGDYMCAEKELRTLLTEKKLGRGTRASAHMLLAAVYFETTEDSGERRQMVRTEFVQGLRSDPNWAGELELTNPEFLSIYNDAREMVDYINRTSPELTVSQPDTLATSTPAEVGKSKKPWYRKWWALGSGVGVVVLGAVLLLGGSDNGNGGGTTETDTLPGFPPPP